MSARAFWEPVVLSLKISFAASLIVLLLGGCAAWFMSRKRRRGAVVIETLFMLPLVLPPTVVGFVLLLLLGRHGWGGQLTERLFDRPLLFTPEAAVIASVVVAFPLVYRTMKLGFASVDRHLEDAARSAGANEWQVLRWVTLPLAGSSVLSAYVLGFARALGEFGATLMVAGNIPGRTQTVPTAIYVAVDGGNMTLAWLWTLAIIGFSFALLLLTGAARK